MNESNDATPESNPTQGQPCCGESCLPEAELDDLFDVLVDGLEKHGCDHSRRLTMAWLKSRGHDVEVVLAWLDSTGGYCDCEVLLNSLNRA